MDEEFRREDYETNGTENKAEEVNDEAPQEARESEEIPSVEAQVVEEPQHAAAPNEESKQPQYSYAQQPQGGQPPYQSYSAQPNDFRQPVAPIQNPKTRKGIKAFVACIALVIVFALGFGISSIVKYSSNKDKSSENNVLNSDSPQLSINDSPVTPSDISAEGELTPVQIYAKLKDSNVGIVVYSQNSNSSVGQGSGVIMGEDKSGNYTYIITCAHVISDSGISARVQTVDGTTYDAEIVGFDKRTDLGVLKIKANGLQAAEFGNSDVLRVGDRIYAIGNPGGVEFFGSFTDGYVSAIDRPVSSEIGYTMKCIQHSAAINPGNSGGMLVNAYGQVIGINSQKIAATDYEGMGFAIPITAAKEIIEDLINYNYVPNRPMLGITYYPVSASAQYSMIARIKGLPAGTLVINEISANSSLANTEARKYDMIIAVDGEPLTTADVLLERIDNGKVGDKMKLTLCRVNSDYSTEEFDIEITLVEDKGSSEPETTTTVQYVDPFEYFNKQFGY